MVSCSLNLVVLAEMVSHFHYNRLRTYVEPCLSILTNAVFSLQLPGKEPRMDACATSVSKIRSLGVEDAKQQHAINRFKRYPISCGRRGTFGINVSSEGFNKFP